MAASSIAATQVEGVYGMVIEDVIENLQQTFADDGLDETVLTTLRLLWMEKLNLHKSVATSSNGSGSGPGENAVAFYPHRPIPQTDGSGDRGRDTQDDGGAGSAPSGTATRDGKQHSKAFLMSSVPASSEVTIPQVDGASDAAGSGTVSKPARKNSISADDIELNSDDDDLNSDDDDDDDDDDENNYIICQFDKIQRVRNRYKATLRNVIMQFDGTDYMFSKATGTYTW